MDLITVITPPSLFFPTKGPKIFLAGSVNNGKAVDWQTEAITYIEETWTKKAVIYNPRRPDGDFLPENEVEQATWTISMLNAADYILLNLAGDSGSPISTFELGLFVNDKRLHLSIDDSYIRKEIIEIHYDFFGIGQIYDTLGDSIDAIEAKILNG